MRCSSKTACTTSSEGTSSGLMTRGSTLRASSARSASCGAADKTRLMLVRLFMSRMLSSNIPSIISPTSSASVTGLLSAHCSCLMMSLALIPGELGDCMRSSSMSTDTSRHLTSGRCIRILTKSSTRDALASTMSWGLLLTTDILSPRFLIRRMSNN